MASAKHDATGESSTRYNTISPIVMRHYHDLIHKRESQTSINCKHDKYKHMCVILDKGGEALISGYNIFKTNSQQTEHAEAMAIRKFFLKFGRPKRRITVDILVVRTNGGNSKPCTMCLEQMRVFSYIVNVKNIYYSHEDEPTGIRKEKFTTMINSDDQHMSSYYRHLIKIKQGSDSDSVTSDDSVDDDTDSDSSSRSLKFKQRRNRRT
jgi:tRNA(Arg) A34 adenosine deaminase TadA